LAALITMKGNGSERNLLNTPQAPTITGLNRREDAPFKITLPFQSPSDLQTEYQRSAREG